MTEQFSKNCPKCKKEIFYTSKSNLYRSRTNNSICCNCTNSKLKKNIVNRNNDFFENINTEEKSYWLGFLFADGCIRPRKRGFRIDISLAKQDYLHLEKLANLFDNKIKFYCKKDKKRNKEYLGCNLGFSDEKMWNDLNDKGLIHRKTYKNDSNKIFDSIPRRLVRHFIRGYFDGDGTVGWNSKIGISSCYMGFVSYTNEILEKINTYITEDIGINNKHIYGNESKYVLTWTGRNQLYCLFNFLYSDSTIFLERKKEKFEKIYKYSLFKRKNKGCKYNGVYLSKNKKPYRARIWINGRRNSLGSFSTPEQAARVWDKVAIENNFPKYKLNFIGVQK